MADVHLGITLLDVHFDGLPCIRGAHLDRHQGGLRRNNREVRGLLPDPAAQLVGVDAVFKGDGGNGNAGLTLRNQIGLEFMRKTTTATDGKIGWHR